MSKRLSPERILELKRLWCEPVPKLGATELGELLTHIDAVEAELAEAMAGWKREQDDWRKADIARIKAEAVVRWMNTARDEYLRHIKAITG